MKKRSRRSQGRSRHQPTPLGKLRLPPWLFYTLVGLFSLFALAVVLIAVGQLVKPE